MKIRTWLAVLVIAVMGSVVMAESFESPVRFNNYVDLDRGCIFRDKDGTALGVTFAQLNQGVASGVSNDAFTNAVWQIMSNMTGSAVVFTFHTNLTIGGKLYVCAAMVTSNNVNIAGVTTMGVVTDLTQVVLNSLTVNTNLTVTKASTLGVVTGLEAVVLDSLTVNTNLTVTRTALLSSNVTVGGKMDVAAVATFSNNVSIAGCEAHAGASTNSGAVVMTGGLNAQGGLVFTGIITGTATNNATNTFALIPTITPGKTRSFTATTFTNLYFTNGVLAGWD
jgi:hypothetical protein